MHYDALAFIIFCLILVCASKWIIADLELIENIRYKEIDLLLDSLDENEE